MHPNEAGHPPTRRRDVEAAYLVLLSGLIGLTSLLLTLAWANRANASLFRLDDRPMARLIPPPPFPTGPAPGQVDFSDLFVEDFPWSPMPGLVPVMLDREPDPIPEAQEWITLGALGSGADLEVKEGVHLEELAWPVVQVLPIVVQAWKHNRAPRPVVTSGNDGLHCGSWHCHRRCRTEEQCRQTSNSAHYRNLAIDLRANNLRDRIARRIVRELRTALGPRFRIQFESYRRNPSRDHIHLAFEPLADSDQLLATAGREP
jgi:hypothetical protein